MDKIYDFEWLVREIDDTLFLIAGDGKEVIGNYQANDILLETDSPYMAPEPVRGKKNSPLNLKYIVDFISKVKNISYEEVINITSDNAKSLFDL